MPTVESRPYCAPRPELPSTNAVQMALDGVPGGWGKVALSTGVRAALIAPAIWLVGGVRGWRLAGTALGASATITAFLFAFYLAKRRLERSSPVVVQPVQGVW